MLGDIHRLIHKILDSLRLKSKMHRWFSDLLFCEDQIGKLGHYVIERSLLFLSHSCEIDTRRR